MATLALARVQLVIPTTQSIVTAKMGGATLILKDLGCLYATYVIALVAAKSKDQKNGLHDY